MPYLDTSPLVGIIGNLPHGSRMESQLSGKDKTNYCTLMQKLMVTFTLNFCLDGIIWKGVVIFKKGLYCTSVNFHAHATFHTDVILV